jgi:DNA end-binding protein Ku
MEKAGKIGIASFVMRNKEYLVAIRPEPDVLALETMYFADEIRDPVAELPHLSEAAKVKPRERDMAQTLIDALAEKWDPSDYHDSYREHVRALIKDKKRGHDTVTHAEPERGGKVIDLLEALQASVKKAGDGSSGPAKKRPAATKRAASKKRPAATKRAASKKRAAAKAEPAKKATTAADGAKKRSSAPRRRAS